jgi:hypothetical protein
MRNKLVPFALTPSNITVIRFTQLGMLVKSMLVPLVLATEVLLVIPPRTEVPVMVVAERVGMVVDPSVPSTMLLLPLLGFLMLDTLSVPVPVMVVAERVGMVVDPSVPRTMLLLPLLGFLRFVVNSVDT